jgi:hypothetical protein
MSLLLDFLLKIQTQKSLLLEAFGVNFPFLLSRASLPESGAKVKKKRKIAAFMLALPCVVKSGLPLLKGLTGKKNLIMLYPK